MLSARRIRFCQEYCVDWNGTRAAIAAGYSENGASVRACELLADSRIKEKIEERKEELAAAAGVTVEFILNQWRKLALADAGELTQVRRVNCRHCHGFDHRYQWTEAEFMQRMETNAGLGKDMPDGTGGFGFEVNGEPNADCPECGGDGIEYIYIADTRKLTGSAKVLYAGVKKTKEGVEIKTRDQDGALKNLSGYLGMNKEQLNIVHREAKSLEDFYAVAPAPGTNVKPGP